MVRKAAQKRIIRQVAEELAIAYAHAFRLVTTCTSPEDSFAVTLDKCREALQEERNASL
jgi:hypothetical protein